MSIGSTIVARIPPRLLEPATVKVLRRSEQVRVDRYPGVPRYGMADTSLGSSKLHFGDLTYEVGSAVPHHNHPDAEETQIMLEGELECWLDGHRFTVRAGDCIVAKRGVGHAFFNRTDRPARMITAFSVTPPTTDHTPDPLLQDTKPNSGVRFGLWPTGAVSIAKIERYAVNAPVDATETQCEMLMMPAAGSGFIEIFGGQESGVFCVSGTVEVDSGAEATKIGAGDFVFATSENLSVRNVGDHAATLLTVRSLI